MLNTNTTARAETACIDRKALLQNLPRLSEVLTRPIEHIRVADYRKYGNKAHFRRAEAREIVAPLYLEFVAPDEYDPRPWYQVHVLLECGAALPMKIGFYGDEKAETRFRDICENVVKHLPLTCAEYVRRVENIVTDPELREFIGTGDILLMSVICKFGLGVDAYLPYRMMDYRERRLKQMAAKQAATEAEKRAEEEARDKAEQEARAAEKREIVQQLLQGGERIGAKYASTDRTQRDAFARLLAEIAQDCGVNIPIKVRGWMFKSLAAVDVASGKCEGVQIWKDKGTHSATIYKYINQLLCALNDENKMSGSATVETCNARAEQ